ncbi:MAG: hypothetical protein JOZ18_13795, partial [Chloroflexi bacterium]|nr:hypothetical protein [Chloroflexota bacterium]
MIKHSLVRSILLSGTVVLGIIIAVVFAINIQAHAAPAQVATTPPRQSNIVQKTGGTAHFNPKTLACTRHPTGFCITIKNTTHSSQTVSLNGVVVYTLAPSQSQGITYTKKGTYVYS